MKTKLSLFIKRVRDTQAEEINCSVCLDQVSQYVDLELSGVDAATRMPQVRHHLDQCGVCLDEYRVLRDLARLEGEDQLPSNEELKDRLHGDAREDQ